MERKERERERENNNIFPPVDYYRRRSRWSETPTETRVWCARLARRRCSFIGHGTDRASPSPRGKRTTERGRRTRREKTDRAADSCAERACMYFVVPTRGARALAIVAGVGARLAIVSRVLRVYVRNTIRTTVEDRNNNIPSCVHLPAASNSIQTRVINIV